MKRRWTILAGLAVVGALCAFLLLRGDNSEQKALEETRRTLRQQGFKTDLSEFNFSTSPELRRRSAALTNFEPSRAVRTGADYAHRAVLRQEKPELMSAVGSHSALVVWKQDKLESDSGEDLWPALREALDEDRAELDAACAAALSGPIAFDLNASHGFAMLLPHAAALKRLTLTLGRRAVLDLHDQNTDAVWTNLLAATRLVTAWEPEAVEVSHPVRYACGAIAYNATWQVLQAGDWPDNRLAHLQHEWESVDFFKGLPETAAFTRAASAATCQLDRQQPVAWSLPPSEMLRSPRYAWGSLTDHWRQVGYRQYGSYEDEKALLLYYRDRELELRRAVQSPTWSEMRQLPGVTNLVPFTSKYFSRVQSLLNMRQMSLAFQGRGQGLLDQAAEAEARRRVLITAIALERYRGRHGSYPRGLEELVPELLKSPPADFMDGKPLRYRLTGDGHFVLYSVGLDCIDNAGVMVRPRRRAMPYGYAEYAQYSPIFGIQQSADLVWPRPASVVEVKAQQEEEKKAREEEARQAELGRVAEEKKEEMLRRDTIKRLLAAKPTRREGEPEYDGRPLRELLRGKKASGAIRPTLDELLTLKQIITGKEPDIATFEAPMSYDALTNIGSLRLLVDADPEEDFSGRGAQAQTCVRSTNGNCRLVWNTTYDPPGQHALQALLLCTERERSFELKGPVVPFFSSNVPGSGRSQRQKGP